MVTMSLFLFIILICLREPKIVCYLGTFKNKLPLIIPAFIVTHSYIMNSSEVKVPKVTGKSCSITSKSTQFLLVHYPESN